MHTVYPGLKDFGGLEKKIIFSNKILLFLYFIFIGWFSFPHWFDLFCIVKRWSVRSLWILSSATDRSTRHGAYNVYLSGRPSSVLHLRFSNLHGWYQALWASGESTLDMPKEWLLAKKLQPFWNISLMLIVSLVPVVWRKLWRWKCQTWEGRTQTSSGSLYSSSF